MFFGRDEPMGVTKLMGAKNPASSREGGADLGPISFVFSSLSSSLLALGPGKCAGEPCDLVLFFLTLPARRRGAGGRGRQVHGGKDGHVDELVLLPAAPRLPL